MKATTRFLLLCAFALALGATACVKSPAAPDGPDPDDDHVPGDADTLSFFPSGASASPSPPVPLVFSDG